MAEFAGIQQQVHNQDDLRVVYTHCAAGTHLADHHHRHAFLSFLISGAYLEGSDPRMQSCRSNDLTWHPPGDRHEVLHGPEPVSSLQFEFIGGVFEGIDLDGLPTQRHTVFFPGVRSKVIEVRKEMLRADGFSAVAIRGRLLQLMAGLGREIQNRDIAAAKLVGDVENAIKEVFPNHPDLNTLARSNGLTPAQLSYQFQRHTRKTLREAWQRYRLRQACRLLTESELPIAQVAVECGYYDQSHFTHSFSKAMNCTPGAFRRQ